MKSKEEQEKDWAAVKDTLTNEPPPYANRPNYGTKHKKYPTNYTKPKGRKKK